MITGTAGRPGTEFGTTAAEDGDEGPEPLPLVALTLHVYDLPFVSPVTVIGDEPPGTLALAAPPFDETHFVVNPVIAEPPSDGATNDTTIRPAPPTTVGAAGADGSEPSTTAADCTEAGPSPLTFDAKTVHV